MPNTTPKFDKRLCACRDDLADLRLKNICSAKAYVEGELYYVNTALLAMHAEPSKHATRTNTLIYGCKIRVFENVNGWSWVQSQEDDYVGYVESTYLENIKTMHTSTHHVSVPLTFIYEKTDKKSATIGYYPLLSQLCFTDKEQDGEFFCLNSGGYILAQHLYPYDGKNSQKPLSFIDIARQFIATPYLWGGNSWLGTDCSGLVAIASRAAGYSCPRDSDMQQKTLGHSITRKELTAGDIVFFKGHVGIMNSPTDLLHSNMYYMKTTIDPLDVIITRAGEPLAYKRL